MSNNLPTPSARDAIAVQAAQWVAELSTDPAARAAAMDWAATSPHHAVALARAEAAWDAAARLRALPPGRVVRRVAGTAGRPRTMRIMVLLGMLAASIIGGIAITATIAARPSRCTTALARPFALATAGRATSGERTALASRQSVALT